ncbi:hypothetical protein QR98_0013320 [Sarcoptes scabiei]|uniref:Uncharacterized protein n=1 Tax=Sarcoptes scabiei TaxID=52283 RepID=A0A131ZVU2_SARSC|nr:hypothetical protein QR98_0013320 [Sarcoptes scabiei]
MLDSELKVFGIDELPGSNCFVDRITNIEPLVFTWTIQFRPIAHSKLYQLDRGTSHHHPTAELF